MNKNDANTIKIAAYNALAAINEGDTAEAISCLRDIALLAAKLDTTTAEYIAELDHNTLVSLSEIAAPETHVDGLIKAELAKRGLTCFLPTEQV